MNIIRALKNNFIKAKNKFNDDSYDGLLWLVNIIPNLAGFSLKKDKISPWFWCIHFPMLFYIYGVGNFVYQWKFAKDPTDFIKSYVNVSLLILIANNSWWFLKYRPLLSSTLKKVSQNDDMARQSAYLQPKHKQLLKITKIIVSIFYGSNFFNAAFVYLPNRVDISGNFYMTPCVGLEPLTTSPNREICLTLLALQEFSIMTVVLNYQALLLCLISHTAVMYQLLSYEMMNFNKPEDNSDSRKLAKQKLPMLIDRHTLTLDIVDKLKLLYSVPIGVNFGSNAVCIAFFFYLPIQEWLQFMPILVYCFLVFFLYCFLGQRLVNASELFERSIYCCGWENFDLKEKRLVFVMLRQSQKKIELLAADIIPVNIYTFATTLQAMFKFVTVVKF